mmetsp:Transcript_6770/g.11052  ORF Transcript_6770/g.11052 Transcript_6770/m.11052 type:complete len:116 (-) Transcript_6770:735-1082(-)
MLRCRSQRRRRPPQGSRTFMQPQTLFYSLLLSGMMETCALVPFSGFGESCAATSTRFIPNFRALDETVVTACTAAEELLLMTPLIALTNSAPLILVAVNKLLDDFVLGAAEPPPL